MLSAHVFAGDMCSNRKKKRLMFLHIPDVIICRKTANLIYFTYAVFLRLDRLTIYAADEKRNWQNIAATAPHFAFSHFAMSSQVMISGHFNRLSFSSAGSMNSPV